MGKGISKAAPKRNHFDDTEKIGSADYQNEMSTKMLETKSKLKNGTHGLDATDERSLHERLEDAEEMTRGDDY